MPAHEVDVVQLVPVDEPPAGDVADGGIVLPAVPETARDFNGIGGLVEQVDGADVASAEQLGLVSGAADPDLPTGPPMGDEVKRGNRFGYMEGFGVGDGRDRDEPDVVGHRRHPGRDEDGIGPSRQPTRFDLGAAPPLRGERVVEGQEVQQPALGRGGQAGPVAAAGDGLTVRRVSPRLRMPAVAVERDAQVQMPGHRSAFSKATG